MSSEHGDANAGKPPLIVRCPTCRKSLVFDAKNRWRPFCSERCRLIDLGEWASEGHRIPGAEIDAATDGENEPV